MIRASTPLILAMLSVLALAALGAWGWWLDPEHPTRWARVMFLLPFVWGLVELAQPTVGRRAEATERIRTWHRSVVAWAGLVLAVGIGVQLGVAANLLDADWLPIGRRARGVLFAVGMALWGNYLPKMLSPWRLENEPFAWQRVHRFAGWIASFGGIALVGAWLALPLDRARSAEIAIVGISAVLIAARKLASVTTHSGAGPPRSDRLLPSVASRRGQR